MMIKIGNNGHGDSTAPALQVHDAVTCEVGPVRNLLLVRRRIANASLEPGTERMI